MQLIIDLQYEDSIIWQELTEAATEHNANYDAFLMKPL